MITAAEISPEILWGSRTLPDYSIPPQSRISFGTHKAPAPVPAVEKKTGLATPGGSADAAAKIFTGLLRAWELTGAEGAILLGLDNLKKQFVENLAAGKIEFWTRDIEDRIRYLFEIDGVLLALYRDDAVVRKWLRAPEEEFDGKSPLDFMLEGPMENLLLVMEFTEFISGR